MQDNNVSTIPTEALNGCVIRQLYHGRPHLVFVQHEQTDGQPRAAFEVKRNGPGGFKPTGKRMQFEGHPTSNPTKAEAESINILKPIL